MFEDYKKKQEELDNEEKRAQQEYDAATELLSDYKKDLEVLIAKFTADKEALKVKHDYHNKNEIFTKASERLYDTQIAKRDAKILFVLDAINTFLEHPFYKNLNGVAWRFLWEEWGVQHSEYNYSFHKLYETIKTSGIDAVNINVPFENRYDNKYIIWDNEDDQGDIFEFEIDIPKKIVDNLDDFIKSIEAKINGLESEMKNREETKRRERLKLYEQLKTEFGA